MEVHLKKYGATTIGWIPQGRNMCVIDDENHNEEKKRLMSVGLIDPGSLSDSERASLGFTDKSAAIANASSEEQPVYTVVAVGPEVMEREIDDKVMFMPGCQATSIKIKGKFYLQLGEFECLGKFID